MKISLEQEDIQAIAAAVFEMLKPFVFGNSKHQAEDVIFGVKDLQEYLKVSDKWIYERTHLQEIPHLKINGLLRFRKKDIDKWINSYNVPAVNTPERILKALK